MLESDYDDAMLNVRDVITLADTCRPIRMLRFTRHCKIPFKRYHFVSNLLRYM